MRKIAVISLCLIMVACAETSNPPEINSQDNSGSSQSSPDDSIRQKSSISETGVSEYSNHQRKSQTTGATYQCPSYANSCTVNDLLVAASNEEADWLYENGYPSIQEIQEYKDITLEELRAKENKSQTDTLMLSEKMAEKNERNNGKALAHSVAMQGNLYALYVLSEIHAMPGQGYDRTESGAYLKLAYLMGDNKAVDLYYEIYGSLSAPEHLLIDRRASRLMQTMSLNPKKPRPIQ